MCKARPPPQPPLVSARPLSCPLCPPASAALERSVRVSRNARKGCAVDAALPTGPTEERANACTAKGAHVDREGFVREVRRAMRRGGNRAGAGTEWEREQSGRKPWLRRTTAAPPADAAPFRPRPFEPSFLPHQPPPALVAYSSAQPPSVLPSIRSNASGVSHVRSAAQRSAPACAGRDRRTRFVAANRTACGRACGWGCAAVCGGVGQTARSARNGGAQ